MKLSKEAKTAIIILIGIASFIFGVSFIKSSSLFNTDKDYYAVFSHSAGLQSGTNVTANGVNIGTVKQVKIDPQTAKVIVAFSSVDSLMTTFSSTLNAKAQQDIKESLANLNVTLQNMNKASVSLNNLLASSQAPLHKSLANVETLSGNFVQLSDSLSKLQIGKLVADLEGTLNQVNGILQKVEKGNGTVSKLLTDPKLYNNLQTATSELGLLMEDIRLNPKRYVHISVFGKKNQEYETPKKVETPISERN